MVKADKESKLKGGNWLSVIQVGEEEERGGVIQAGVRGREGGVPQLEVFLFGGNEEVELSMNQGLSLEGCDGGGEPHEGKGIRDAPENELSMTFSQYSGLAGRVI